MVSLTVMEGQRFTEDHCREEATDDRQSVAYKLTCLGKGLLPVLREIQDFTKSNAGLGHAVGKPQRKAAAKRRARATS